MHGPLNIRYNLMNDCTELPRWCDVLNTYCSQQLLHIYQLHSHKQECRSVAIGKVFTKVTKMRWFFTLEDGRPIGCPKMSVTKYSWLLYNSPEERSSQGDFSHRNVSKVKPEVIPTLLWDPSCIDFVIIEMPWSNCDWLAFNTKIIIVLRGNAALKIFSRLWTSYFIIIILTANGLIPGGSGYFTCI
jgi:hypothetical protein